MVSPEHWAQHAAPNILLDAAGLLALAELPTLARRTAATGSASLSDVLVLCPGIHRQTEAVRLNDGEYPITANMTSGYVFRTENQGTVAYFQRVSKTGYLTTLTVEKDRRSRALQGLVDLSGPFRSVALYLSTMLLTSASIVFLGIVRDLWGIGIVGSLMLGRLLNVYMIRRRCTFGWHGAKEPGKYGDLLVLLSQDRWVRVQGTVDDLKALTSGQWLRESTFFESSLEGLTIVIVYLCAALASNATQAGKILILVLFLSNAGLLTLSNELRETLHMKSLIVRTAEAVRYHRRLDMADQLIRESGSKDWAIKIGLINDKNTGDNSERPPPSVPTVQV